MKLLKVGLQNGERIACTKTGNKDKTILLIHGNMSSSAHFDLLIGELEKDYTVYAVDMRGFGLSTYNSDIRSLRELAHDLNEVMEELNVEETEVLGWSTGGGVALYLAVINPKLVKRIILMESVGIKGYSIYRKDENGQPIMDEPLKTKEDIALDPIQVAPVLDALQNNNRDFYKGLFSTIVYNVNMPDDELFEKYIDDMLTQRNLVDIDFALTRFNISDVNNGVVDGSNEYKLIKCPVDIVHGENDLVVPLSEAQYTDSMLDDTKLHLLKDCGHNPMIDRLEKLVDIIVKGR